jgi:hypothetical protein
MLVVGVTAPIVPYALGLDGDAGWHGEAKLFMSEGRRMQAPSRWRTRRAESAGGWNGVARPPRLS